MNRHRIIPLAFTITFAIFAPLLALGGTSAKPLPLQATVSTLLNRIDSAAKAAWARWHEKNQAYVELVGLAQK